MPWKTNEDGTIEMQEGNPVWIYEDGKEAGVAFDSALKKIKELNGECQTHREKHESLAQRLKPFESIEDPDEWLGKARSALDTVKNLNDKQILDAGEVDKIKDGVKNSFQEKIKSLETNHKTELDKLQKDLTKKDSAIRNMMIKGGFDRSEFLGQTVFANLRDAAYHTFGNHFDCVEDNGDLKVRAYYDSEKSKPVFSLSNAGDYAEVDEALELILKDHPQKSHILKLDQSGSGKAPGSDGRLPSRKGTVIRGDFKSFGDNLEKIASGEVKVVEN